MMSQLATLGIFASGGSAPAATFRSIVFGSGDDGGGLTGTMEALTLPITFSCWYKYSGGAAAFPVLLESVTADESIYIRESNYEWFARGGNGTAADSLFNASTATWQYLHVQWAANGDVTITMDRLIGTGLEAKTVASTIATELVTSALLSLGQDSGQTKDFPGKIFDAVLIEGAYTPAQLNYDAGTTSPGWVDFTWPASVPGARWAGQTSGTPGADASGNGNTLTQPSGTSTAVTLDAADVPPDPT